MKVKNYILHISLRSPEERKEIDFRLSHGTFPHVLLMSDEEREVANNNDQNVFWK